MFPISRWAIIINWKIAINNIRGKVSWHLQRSHIVLFTSFCMFFRCRLKSNLVSNTIPRCLWADNDLINFWWKYNRGWSILLIFLLKTTSWACFLWSGLKSNHFFSLNYCSDRLLFEFIFWITENRELSSANNFIFEVKPSDKSLI